MWASFCESVRAETLERSSAFGCFLIIVFCRFWTEVALTFLVSSISVMAFTHSTRQACEALQISDRTLLRLRRDGVLKPGDHFRAVGAGLHRPMLRWDVEEVERALARRSRRVLG